MSDNFAVVPIIHSFTKTIRDARTKTGERTSTDAFEAYRVIDTVSEMALHTGEFTQRIQAEAFLQGYRAATRHMEIKSSYGE